VLLIDHYESLAMSRVATLLIAGLLLLGTISFARADQFVNGYTRQNGTVVQPYVRSTPDNSYNNNWSVSPNVNPYTGVQGTHQPTFNDRAPQPQTFGAPKRCAIGVLYC
jgi:hypothetical protein